MGQTKAIYTIIGGALHVFSIQMEFLQISGPLMMETIRQIPLAFYKFQRLMICVDDLLTENVIFSFPAFILDVIHLLIISAVFFNCVGESLTMIGQQFPSLGENYTNRIVIGWLFDV